MALLVKKVVVTEVAVTTVKVEVTKASVLDAAGESIQCANAVNWLPDHLDIDIETGVIRNWSAPTSEQLQHSDNADDLLLDALDQPAPTGDSWWPEDSEPKHRCPISEQMIPFEFDTIDSFYAAQATTPEIQQPVEVATPVQPEVAEIAPEAPQVDSEPTDSNVQKLHTAELGQPSEAFADGVAIAESVLAPVENESESRCPPAKPRYCNPANPEQTWTGRGKQPDWLREQIANGARLEDLLIGANPSPVAPVQDIEQPKHATDLPTVTVSLKDGKWYAMHDDQVASSTQTAFEAVKGVLKRCNKTGVFEINRLETKCENQVFTIDDSRTANTETVYLTKMADGWIAKTPNNKTVTAAISITGELTALLAPIDNIEHPASAIIVDTTDDEIRARGKRRYSITAGHAQAVDVAAPAHAPSVPVPEEQPPATYAEIVQLINFASEVAHLDNIKAMRIDHHADEKERLALVMKMGSKRAEIMAANAMRIN
mgnify:CR=1 FL=1